MAKRWQPPPMNPPAEESDTPRVTVDEKVVRKMLQVNPAMRDGRTTFQVKQDMERGQSVSTDERKATGPVDRSSAPKPSTSKTELDDTIGFFVKGKVNAVQAELESLATQRRALEARERDVRQGFKNELAKFVAMLDPKVVAMHGVSALSKHKALLEQLGLTPSDVLAAARDQRS